MNGKTRDFFLTLSSLVAGGCSLRDAMRSIASGKAALGLAAYAKKCLIAMEDGKGISDSLRTSGLDISETAEGYLVLADRTGLTARALELILEDERDARWLATKVAQAGLYPIIVLALLIAMLVALFTLGVPWLADCGAAFNAEELAAVRRPIEAASIAAVIVALGLGFAGAQHVSRRKNEYVRWRNAQALCSAGLSVGDCLDFEPTPANLAGIGGDGQTRAFLAVAEATGDYGAALCAIAAHHRNELDGSVRRLSSLIEPTLILIVGGIVLTVALTAVLPILTRLGGITL